MVYKKNYYIVLRLKILISIIFKRKLSLKKILNGVYACLAYYLKRKKTGRFPFMITFDLSNECNLTCAFCRTKEGDIHNRDPRSAAPIAKGHMNFGLFTDIIDQVKDYLIMAVLYGNGEPLVYKDLFKAIRYASDRRIATMISTNGLLLHEENITNLLASGLDFIKIVMSGFTQEVHSVQHARGSSAQIKKSIELLAHKNTKGRHGLIIVVDFILYNYNAHEVDAARQFCKNLGVMFNVRPGSEPRRENVPKSEIHPPATTLCDWPWKVLMVNWNGALLACCDYAVWGNSEPYARFIKGETNIARVWNGKEAINNRLVHMQKGRRAIPVCAHCTRQGTAFSK